MLNLLVQVFDILPLYGTLKPGETEQITLTFYGHANIGSKAKALCEVEGGPTYELALLGNLSINLQSKSTLRNEFVSKV